MDKNYIITPNGSFISEDELYHHGVRGMKWGIRRYQNKDGSLTTAGRKRYSGSDGESEGRDTRGNEPTTSKDTNPRKSRVGATEDSGRAERANKKEPTKAKRLLDRLRKKDSETESEDDKTKENESKETKGSKIDTDEKPEAYSMSSLSTKDIRDISNRMQSEDNLKQLLEKRGYTVSLDSKTEIDRKIESLTKEKQIKQLEKDLELMTKGKSEVERKIEELTQTKTIKQLEKDINDLTPKKQSKFSKFINSEAGKSITNQLIKSGENVLVSYLKTKGANENIAKDAVKETSKTLGKEVKGIDKTVKKSVEKQAAKQAKADEKQAAKQAKADEKQAAKQAEKAAKAEAKQAAKEARQEAKIERKEAQRAANDEASAKVINFISGRLDTKTSTLSLPSPSPTSSSSTSSKATSSKTTSSKSTSSVFGNDYEKRVDKMLADMDAKGWDRWYSERGDD